MGGAQVGGYLVGFVEIGDGGGEMGFAGQQDVLGAAGQIGLVLLRELGDGEGVPAKGVGVGKIRPHSSANGCDPSDI